MSLDLANAGAEQDLDSLVNKQILQRRADIGIFAAGKLRTLFDHGDLRAESAERLRKFQAHVAAAEHDEMLGESVEVESLHVRHRFRLCESGNFWNRRP